MRHFFCVLDVRVCMLYTYDDSVPMHFLDEILQRADLQAAATTTTAARSGIVIILFTAVC